MSQVYRFYTLLEVQEWCIFIYIYIRALYIYVYLYEHSKGEMYGILTV